MSSISISEKNQIILKVEDLNMVYRMHTYKNTTWRDFFTDVVKNPIGSLLRQSDSLHLIRDVNFQIGKGERVGLLGINGAGKTSLCRCIARVFSPTSGKITVNTSMRALFNTHMGVHPELSGRENVDILIQFIYPERRDKKEIAREAIEFSGLCEFIEVPFKFYSTGMQVRLYLSVISCRPTGLLILDEVFDGADTFFREKISERVIDLIKNSGAALFVSHSYEQLKTVCTRLLILHEGHIIHDGQLDEGIRLYKSLRPVG